MSVRDQEHRQREAERRIAERMRAADRRVHGSILARQNAADVRANQVIERIERGGVDPRPLPGLREDSMASIESAGPVDADETNEGKVGPDPDASKNR